MATCTSNCFCTGTGAETVVLVKYDAVHGGLLHHDIPYDDITVTLFGQEFLQPNLAGRLGMRGSDFFVDLHESVLLVP